MPPLLALAAALLCGFAGLARPAAAQGLPQAPITWLGGRGFLSGSVSAAAASGGTDTSFNSGDYGQDTMRLVELTLAPSIALHDAAFFSADLRAAGSVNRSDWYFRPARLVVGVRPFPGRPLTVSAGLLQTPFGQSGRGYGRENLLVGLPLIYQYRTALQADGSRGAGVPGGEGPYPYPEYHGYGPPAAAAQSYSYSYVAPGLPLVDTRGWNAGVRLDAGGDRAQVAAALVRGSLSNPLSRDDRPGWQLAGRAAGQPIVGLVVGVSGARGRYARVPGSGASLAETALGADAEISRGYWLVRGEVVHSRREVAPPGAPSPTETLGVTGLDVEGRYRIAPGFYLAGRVGRLWFGGARGTALSWDADVTRFEGGLGWSLSRPLLVKASYQYNRRPGGIGREQLHRVAMQALVWF
ncbi:MAG TPA: hypothetical protein PKK95_07350 [Vicinamibacterales bacterium]|nr:hypothetical protein [Acidobacteriota bacterium]HOC18066.1 hypothetical protein [Vicinamibacterales bacterium]